MATAPPSRRELGIVAAMTFVGAVLRFWLPGRLGLNHFDEGIYAMASTWSLSPKGLASLSPQLVPYAPPLYPILVGVLYLFLGVSDVAAILVSQLAGVLTIPAVAWVAWRTFGPGAGAAASALCALNGPHIAFSRMALTDSTFLLCWVLALGVGGWFLERPGLWRGVVLGLIVGLAQNVKYNGYLAGGIVALSAAWGLVAPSAEGRRGAVRAIGFGLVAAVVAGAAYWPWYQFVDMQEGGYAGLIRHHRGYLTGTTLRAWGEHWVLQLAQSASLSGTITTGMRWGGAAWALAWIGGWLGASGGAGTEQRRWRGARMRIILLLGIMVFGCGFEPQYFASLAIAPFLLFDRRPAARLAALAFLAMAVLTPFYHPYARLALPVHLAGWMIVSGLVVDLGPERAAWARSSRVLPKGKRITIAARRAVLGLTCLGVALADTAAEIRPIQIGSPIGPGDGLRTACTTFNLILANRATPIPRVLVLARPSLLFYLHPPSGTQVVRVEGFEVVRKVCRPGDYLLVDDGLGDFSNQRENPMFDEERFVVNRMRAATVIQFATCPATTWLDIHPQAPLETLPDPPSLLLLYPIIERVPR